MTEVDFILGLLDVRADHYFSSSSTTADSDEHDWTGLRPLYQAQGEALQALAEEIRASMATSIGRTERDTNDQRIIRWLVVTEMGGAMSVRIFNDLHAATEEEERFRADHGLGEGCDSHSRCALDPIVLPPRKTRLTGAIDGRFALIIYADGSVWAEIHETLEEVELALDEARQRHGDEGMYGCHRILIPRQA
ncbi:MAG: hypothetical protein EOP62_12170 [Sphingomonadales bacterium]|nr:MAG: hypothetical protein EOP62_12170 [Sphingomonadales bacterium]